MVSKTIQEICRKVGQYFLGVNGYDYLQNENHILRIEFTEIIDTPERIIFKVNRPGLLIGRKGQHVESLAEILGKKIHIIENQEYLSDYIIPYEGQTTKNI